MRNYAGIASRIEDAIIARIDKVVLPRRPRPLLPPHRPLLACQFAGGAVTDEMIEHAEAVSAAWRRKVRRSAQ